MRLDAKPEGLRQSMAWLHTWSGLVLGWLLYAVFLTGTLSFFLDEMNVWMKPELHRSIPGAQTGQVAMAGMARLAPGAATWTIYLPDERGNAVDVIWRKPGAPAGRAGTERATLDAGTGEAIATRETRGGNFLYRFHFELYAMPRMWARWIVGIATMSMFIAISSGVITHKKIFTDFFTFRRNKGQRSWLDAHNATAVFALPFHLVITFSGLLLLMNMLMPFGRDAVYKGDNQAYSAEFRGQAAPQQGGRGEMRTGAGRARGASAGPVAMADVGPMLAAAAAAWPARGPGSIVVTRPGAAGSTVEVREKGGQSLVARGAGRRMIFDGQTGVLNEAPAMAPVSAARGIYNVMTALHLGHFAGPAMRWILFLSGVIGTLMVATGMILWVVKREADRRKLGRTPIGHRLVEVLNVAGITGLPVAIAAYFYGNRLLPVDLAQRLDWEIRVFFLVWLACGLHALVRRHRSAWREQLGLAAAMFLALPLLNAATGGAGLVESVSRGLWGIAGFDLVAVVMGLGFALAAYRTRAPATMPGAIAAARGRARNDVSIPGGATP